jgi:hypothetical protein
VIDCRSIEANLKTSRVLNIGDRDRVVLELSGTTDVRLLYRVAHLEISDVWVGGVTACRTDVGNKSAIFMLVFTSIRWRLDAVLELYREHDEAAGRETAGINVVVIVRTETRAEVSSRRYRVSRDKCEVFRSCNLRSAYVMHPEATIVIGGTCYSVLSAETREELRDSATG